MQTLINALREIIGTPNFYKQMGGGTNYNYTWDYGAMMEYMLAGMLLLIVVSWVFKSIRWLFSR